jgi:hypothetical protein
MIDDPGSVVVTLKLRMSLKEWLQLRDQLKNEWPSSNLSLVIGDAVSKIQRVIYPDGDLP